jgi:hypothetical protein
LTAELWQFVAVLGVFLTAAVLWLCIIYFPGRTMEYSEASRSKASDGDGGTPGS